MFSTHQAALASNDSSQDRQLARAVQQPQCVILRTTTCCISRVLGLSNAYLPGRPPWLPANCTAAPAEWAVMATPHLSKCTESFMTSRARQLLLLQRRNTIWSLYCKNYIPSIYTGSETSARVTWTLTWRTTLYLPACLRRSTSMS